MLNVGIIGAGDFGARHALAIAELDEVQLVASSRTNAAALAEFTRRFGGRGYTDYRELAGDPAVDAVVIATPHHLHVGPVQAAAAAGKAIFLEKPMAPTRAECDALLASVEQAGVPLFLGHINRFSPAFRQAKALLASGEAGEPVLGVSYMVKQWMEPNRREWHLDRETGGGMLMTAGIHALDRLIWLVDAPVISVYASLATRYYEQKADDASLLQLTFANGAVGSVVSVGYNQGASIHQTQLCCTQGVLRIGYDRVEVGRGERWQSLPPPEQGEDWMHQALINEWRAFVAAAHGESPPEVSGEDALHVMDVIFAAEESARSRRVIAVG
ncbi:MAG: Gfo/Idh/MocA family oxidoreductase [Caldilineaceae bacterium]|nr:Gfo/Idh/MocA family oxidoreductase [Caldilineaceae bacterium]